MALAAVTLDDKYTVERGRVYLTGTQALVRLPLMQRQRDLAGGLNTACFISGYRGSPLGGFDQALWNARRFIERNHIKFQPGINEEMAATAVWGSQQLGLFPGAKYDGVFGMWYGKGPGVDRSGDALKHANLAGTAPHGGVLAVAGDDHTCKSSTLAHQSEFAFIDAAIPLLNPAGIEDIIDLGIYGWAMSRYPGCWVAFKTVAETMDSSAAGSVDPGRIAIVLPEDVEMPPGGLNIRWPDTPLDQEYRLHRYKLAAAIAFARANGLDGIVIDSPTPRFGIVTTGKSYLDVRQALDDLGIAARLATLEAKERQHSGSVVPFQRTPYFCSGCPHNTSTRVPEGSRALAGIGCHYLSQFMDRETATFTQMGGEGVPWIGQAPFTETQHVFANIGDGTYTHSGILAIRSAVAAGVNMTYKVLFNDAVAMTGGQALDGGLTVPIVTRQLAAEGVRQVVVVSDEPEKYPPATDFAPGTSVRHPEEPDLGQRERREIGGVTAIVYDQTCAAEKRRRRKRGRFPDPPKRGVINDLVCEGCGDCSTASNCLSVVPVETEFGRKRALDQSSCNKDYSCLKGFCPSFVTVEGGSLRKREAGELGEDGLPPLPEPELPALAEPLWVLLPGVGGP